MLAANKSTGLALTVALLLSQTIALADESSSTSIKTSTPLGSASTSVHVNSGALGTTKTVARESSNGNEAKSSSYRAEVGTNGAEISSQKHAVRANADGSVTSAHSSESHAINAAGTAHAKSSSSTTVEPDGTNTTVKEEHSSVNK
jgi:hypothetical protein